MIHLWFKRRRRKQQQRKSQAELERTVNRIGSEPASPLEQEDVTDVLDCALERMQRTHRTRTDRMLDAINDRSTPVPEKT